MTREELKQAIIAQGYTLKDFAAKIKVSYGTLRHALNGTHALTPAMQNHILLALGLAEEGERPASGALVIAYRVDVEAGRVLALESSAPTLSARQNALASIIRHNVEELRRAGSLPDDLRALVAAPGAADPTE